MRATMTGSFLNKDSIEKFISKQAFILAKETETVVTSILRAATYGTPKWSGFATEAWTVSFNKNVSATKNDNGGKPPEYDGIGGGLAAALNVRVTELQSKNVATVVSKSLLSTGHASVYITNTAEHSDKWLGDTLTLKLRDLNADYYTFTEIKRQSSSQIKSFWRLV